MEQTANILKKVYLDNVTGEKIPEFWGVDCIVLLERCPVYMMREA